MTKAYVYRVWNYTGKKEYKRTKCSNYWAQTKDVCWKFSLHGAKKIVETLNSFNRFNQYTYGIETVEC